MLKLQRSEKNPILKPSELSWENMLVFNPAAIIVGDMVYLIYRALGRNYSHSCLGLATSKDGINFERRQEPFYSGGGHLHESLGIEDPRIVQIEDKYYLTYTAVSEDIYGEVDRIWKEQIAKKPVIALSTTKDFLTFVDYSVIVPNLSGKDSSLFPTKVDGKYWLLYREGVGKTYFAKSSALAFWHDRIMVFEERPGYWDCKRTGIGAPPIQTEKGWLLFYHGVDNANVYRLGIMFLDLKNPSKILYRSPEPIFEPEKDYEKSGYIENVVFTCGAIEKDGLYYVYYGAADRVIGVATVEKKLVLDLF
jgi:beta-1,2-mannobiose phosphorylase / 1,2-beta-oligomannan phosphorylase